MVYILATIFMFGFLIAIHEFGHFITAKYFGVKVNEFAIGMGPAIWKKQRGETLYALRIFPIGGYCAMEGEDEDSSDPRAFGALTPWKKIIVLSAGAFMNFVVGVILCLALMAPLQAFVVPVIDSVEPTFPNQGETGLMAGDRITWIDGQPIFLYADVTMFFSRAEGGTIDLVVERDGESIKLDDFPLVAMEYPNEDGTTTLRYGINFTVEEATWGNKLVNGWYTAIDFVRLVVISLQDMFSGLVGLDELSGPVGIVDVVSDVGSSSPDTVTAVYNITYFAALIAVNLAVMNLLPLPALDGGRIFFTLLNMITMGLCKKKIPDQYEGYVHMAGMLLLLTLTVVVTVSDISKLF